MLEKMVLTSSPSNEWIQEEEEEKNHKIDDHMVSIMDKKLTPLPQQQQQQQQEALRCPRCDSNNTKFCYYNNYSLSQPRHFCKACKRYWTRGGTLRSVPVGGGCRKNKRLKRPNTTSTTTTNSNNLPSGNGADTSGLGSNPGSNSLFYDFPSSNNNDLMNFPFLRYDVESNGTPLQINGLELGFSYGNGELFRNLDNTNNSNKQSFQDLVSSNTLLSNYGNNNNNSNTTLSSLLASTLQMKGNNFGTILPSSYDEGGFNIKGGVKMEFEGQNRSFDHQCSSNDSPPNNPNDQMGLDMDTASPDPNLIWGNGPNVGAWLDPSNNHLGSSISSLI